MKKNLVNTFFFINFASAFGHRDNFIVHQNKFELYKNNKN